MNRLFRRSFRSSSSGPHCARGALGIAGALVAAVVFSACGQGVGPAQAGAGGKGAENAQSESAEDVSAGTQTEVTTGPADAASASASVEPLSPTTAAEVAGPLDEYLGTSDGDADGSADAAADSFDAEQLIAECMASKGFVYLPVDYSTVFGGQSDVWKYSGTRQFAVEYGYGISTLDAVSTEDDIPAANPNDVYLDGLSAAKREAYFAALYGADPTATGDPGCQVQAVDSRAPSDPAGDTADFAQFEDLYQEIEDLNQDVLRHPKVIAAVRTWSQCMTKAGYPGLTNVDDAQALIQDEFAEIYGWDEVKSSTVLQTSGVAVDEDALADLREKELQLALADFDCQTAYREVGEDVRIDLESEFVAQHQAELSELKETLGG